jgi:ABC-type dipeptide/oligopeptide/nickel transport system permease component
VQRDLGLRDGRLLRDEHGVRIVCASVLNSACMWTDDACKTGVLVVEAVVGADLISVLGMVSITERLFVYFGIGPILREDD